MRRLLLIQVGFSASRWDADTLVIDTVGFNEGTWIDMGAANRIRISFTLLNV